ncbi:MAG: hypothetical protein ACJA1I_001395 [Zhongshania marina]|jgi:hypothetical protein
MGYFTASVYVLNQAWCPDMLLWVGDILWRLTNQLRRFYKNIGRESLAKQKACEIICTEVLASLAAA